ncbi:hypothetical protein ACFR9U_05345 [Halorientalis brevis]|uniref:Outer membrane lipoprotein-sorting protein n=1 Tax=Halorientalis brevis TaxID=1126241 RepID=A0ABD6C9L7_9EURY|nr:hypothetical protein [Halorientalis brevis]
MERKQVLACLAVAVLAFGAGCSGFLGNSESTATPGTGTDATESQRPVAVDGSLDATALFAMHNDTVRSAETFTQVGTVGGVFDTTMRANVSSGEVRATIERSGGRNSTAVYVDETGTQYSRVVTASGTEYYVTDGLNDGPDDLWKVTARPDENPIGSATIRAITATNWTVQGNTTSEGTTLLRFTASGLDATDRYDAATASSFTAELLVEPGRGIRKLNETVTRPGENGSTKRFSIVVEYTDFDTTAVDAPDWTDEARAQAADG